MTIEEIADRPECCILKARSLLAAWTEQPGTFSMSIVFISKSIHVGSSLHSMFYVTSSP